VIAMMGKDLIGVVWWGLRCEILLLDACRARMPAK